MSNVATVGRLAALSVVWVVALLLTAVELVIAIVLTAAIAVPGWQNGLVGLAYVAAILLVTFRAVTNRSSFRGPAFELLAVDLVALPFALAALSM